MAGNQNTCRAGRAREALGLIALFALIWAPFIARILAGESALSGPLTHDIGFQWIPFKAFIRQSLADGYFPLWSHQVFAGFPFSAFSHTGVFYPLGLLFLAGDYAKVVNWFYPLHLCIAGAGVYALCRSLKLSPIGAWLAAFTYAFTGKPYYFIHFLPSVCSNVWMPWLIFSLIRLVSRGRAVHFILAALFLALQVLGGDVESTAYGLLFTVPLLALLVWKHNLEWSRQKLILLFSAAALAALFALVQLLPLLEYSEHFIRSEGVTFDYFRQRKFPIATGWALLLPVKSFPELPELVIEGSFFYLGLLTVALAGVAFIFGADRSSRGLGLLAAAALVWSFGSFKMVDLIQYHLPVLRSMGSPEHAFFMGQLFIAVLAGQGLEWIGENEKRKRRARALILALGFCLAFTLLGSHWFMLWSRTVLIAGVLIAGLAMVIALNFLRSSWWKPSVLMFLVLFQIIDIYSLARSCLPRNKPDQFEYSADLKKIADQIRESRLRHVMVSRLGLRDPELIYQAGLALDVDAIDGWITVPPRNYAELLALADPRTASFVDGKLNHLGLNVDFRDGLFIDAPAMPILDLLSLGYIIDRDLNLKFSSPIKLNLLVDQKNRHATCDGLGDPLRLIISREGEPITFELFLQEGDMLVFEPLILQSDRKQQSFPGNFRIEVESEVGGENIFKKQIMSITGSGALCHNLYRTQQVDLNRYAGQEVSLIFSATSQEGATGFALDWASITNQKKPFQMMEPLSDSEIKLFSNREVLPRSFIVHEAEVVKDDQEMLDRLRGASRYLFSQNIFLTTAAEKYVVEGLSKPAPGAGQGRAWLLGRGPGFEKYRVFTPRPGFLFMSEQYYPGWRAFVEGKELPVLRADHCLRAVPIQPGEFEVDLRFQPASFRVGLWATLAAALGIMLSLFVRCRSRKTATPVDPPI